MIMESEKTGLPPNDFKLNFKITPKRNVGKDYVYLQCITGGHNKDYELRFNGQGMKGAFIVETRYGKIGSSKKVDYHQFETASEAYNFINQKMGEKFKKGYIRVMIDKDGEQIKYKYKPI